MTAQDGLESARRALWASRKSLDDTPAGGTIAPQLRGVYGAADRAHSALTVTGDHEAALQHVRDARAILTGAQINAEALEQWLGSDAGGDTAESFRGRLAEELDAASRAIEAAVNPQDGPRP